MSWRSIAEQYYARIAELEAETSRLKAENHFAGSLTLANQNRIAELEAERDRFKAALTEIAGMADIGLNIGPVIRMAQAALSGEGVT